MCFDTTNALASLPGAAMGTGGGEGSGPGLRLGRGRLQGRGAAGYGGTNPTDNRIDKVNDLYFRCIAVRFLGGVGGDLSKSSHL